MTIPFRFLAGVNSSVGEPPEQTVLDPNFVVILAALLCALICVLGLVAVVRCVWLHRTSGDVAGAGLSLSAQKGLKKKVLQTLPKFKLNRAVNGKLADCVICLTELVDGDEIRVLPPCGHGFHVGCIDTWLNTHSSCPSCRQILVAGKCQKFGGAPATSSSVSRTEVEMKSREDMNRFLP